MAEANMPGSDPRIGVLALQGDFARHLEALESVGACGCEVRSAQDLIGLDALILPGGETSTISHLLDKFHMRQSLLEFVRSKPVWGSCAGLILLSNEIVDSPDAQGVKVTPLGALDVSVVRNSYGRQVRSFQETVTVSYDGLSFAFEACYIRAPRIVRVGHDVIILAKRGGDATLVRQGNILASSFHSELTDDTALTRFFVERVVLCGLNKPTPENAGAPSRCNSAK